MAVLRIIGPGRAGGAFATALDALGWTIEPPVGRDDHPAGAGHGVDLVLICTPDAAIAAVAAAIEPTDAVVAHVAGSLGLDVLAPHARRAAIHPLMSLPDAAVGAERLRGGGWFATAGDPIAAAIVASLGGHALEIADEDRAIYHATACVASNHVVALLGQVERLATGIGVPVEAYLALTRASVDNVERLGPAHALTGPAARGDDATIARHLRALPDDEAGLYRALVDEARRLAGHADRHHHR